MDTHYNKTKNSGFVYALAFYFLLLPLGALNLSEVLGSLLKYIALVPMIAWLFSNRGSLRVYINKPTRRQISFVIWLSISILFSVEPSLSVSRVITQWLFVLLLIPVSSFLFCREDIHVLKGALIWSSRLTALIVLLFSSSLYGRLYLRGVISEDPNYLCAYFLFGIVAGLKTLVSPNSHLWKRIVSIVELFIYCYIVLATGSRGGLLSIVVAVIIYILFTNNEKVLGKNFYRKLLIIIIVLLSVVLALKFVPDNVKNRFLWSEIANSNGTGRFDLWHNGITVFKNSDILRRVMGCGTGAIRSYMSAHGYVDKVMHNIFIEVMIEAGYIGLLLYVSSIISYFKPAVAQKNMFVISILFGMVVLSLSTSLYAFKPYWNILLFSLCCFNTNEERI